MTVIGSLGASCGVGSAVMLSLIRASGVAGSAVMSAEEILAAVTGS